MDIIALMLQWRFLLSLNGFIVLPRKLFIGLILFTWTNLAIHQILHESSYAININASSTFHYMLSMFYIILNPGLTWPPGLTYRYSMLANAIFLNFLKTNTHARNICISITMSYNSCNFLSGNNYVTLQHVLLQLTSY